MASLNLENHQILVIEDEDLNWYLLRDMIEMYNGISLWADSGMKAIDMIQKNNSIDLVLVDLNLPFMSGTETAVKIKSIRPELPIIAQTAFAEQDLLVKAINAGCNSYILKPIDFAEFTEMLKVYFA
jgi:CheY-like chemotaxis protein